MGKKAANYPLTKRKRNPKSTLPSPPMGRCAMGQASGFVSPPEVEAAPRQVHLKCNKNTGKKTGEKHVAQYIQHIYFHRTCTKYYLCLF